MSIIIVYNYFGFICGIFTEVVECRSVCLSVDLVPFWRLRRQNNNVIKKPQRRQRNDDAVSVSVIRVLKWGKLRRVLIGQRKYAVSIARASMRYRYNYRYIYT